MTQMILTIDNPRVLPSLKTVLGMIEGVTIQPLRTKIAATRKPSTATLATAPALAALEEGRKEYAEGRYKHFSSVNELFDSLG